MPQANLPPPAPQLPGTGYLRAGSLVAVVGTSGDFWLAEILSNGAAKVPWIRWLDSRGDDGGSGAIPYEWCVGRDPLDRQCVLSKSVLFNRRSCTLPRDEHVRLCELRQRHQHFPVLAAPKEVSVSSVTKDSAPIKESAPAKEKAASVRSSSSSSSRSGSKESSSDEIIIPAKKRRPPVKSTAKKAAKPAAKVGLKKPPSSSSASNTEESSSSEEPPPPKRKAPVKKTTTKPAAKKAPAKPPAAKGADKPPSAKSESASEPADAPVWIQRIVDPTKAGLVSYHKLSKEGRARRRKVLYDTLRLRHPPSNAATSLDGVWDMYLSSHPGCVRRAAFAIKYPSLTVQHADLRPGSHRIEDVEWKGGPAGVAFVLRVDDPPPGWSPVATYAVCTTGKDTARGTERLRLHEGEFELRRVAGEPVAGQGDETSQVLDTQMTPVVCSPERLKQQRSVSPQSAWSVSPPRPMPDATPTDNAWAASPQAEAGRHRIEDDACTPSHTTDGYVPLHVARKRSRSSEGMSPQPPEPKRPRASQVTQQQLMTQASTTVVMGRSAQPPTPAKPTDVHEVHSLSSGSLTQREAVGELSKSRVEKIECAKTSRESMIEYVSQWLSRHPPAPGSLTGPGSPSTTSANATQLVKPLQTQPHALLQPQASQPQPSPTPAAHQASQSTIVDEAAQGSCVQKQAFQIWWTGMKSKTGYDQQAIRDELATKLGAHADWFMSVTVETFGVKSVAVLHVNTSIRPLALRGLAAKLEHAVPVILNNVDFEQPQKRAAAAPTPKRDANTLMFVTMHDQQASANDLVSGHRILMDVGNLHGHEFVSQLVLNTRARSTVAFVVFSVAPPSSIIERLQHYSYNSVKLCGKSPTSADAAKVPRPY